MVESIENTFNFVTELAVVCFYGDSFLLVTVYD